MYRTYIDEDCEHIRKKRRIDRFDFFEDLPDELLERILALTFNAKSARFVCRKWHGIVSDNSFFRTLCLHRWGEDITPIKYEHYSSEKKSEIIRNHFLPLVKDENNGDKVDWNRYYKIRSNYEKFLWLECSTKSSELKRAKLKKIIHDIRMGDIEYYPEVSYRAMKLLCDLARIYIEEDNMNETHHFIVNTWGDYESEHKERAKFNTKMCYCLLELYYFAKRKFAFELKSSLIRIANRFVVSSLDPKILAALMNEEPEPFIVVTLHFWFNLPLTSSNDGITNEVPKPLLRKTDIMYEATQRLFSSKRDYAQKLKVLETATSITQNVDPEFDKRILKLIADPSREKFDGQSLTLLAKLVIHLKEIIGDEEFIFLVDVALRRKMILFGDYIQQFYIASALLNTLDEARTLFFTEDDLRLLHQALLGYNLKDIETYLLTGDQIQQIPKLLLFGHRVIPYLPQYDRFLFEGQSHNPKLAAFYLCDVLGRLQPDEAVQKITALIEQRTHSSLGAIIAEGYDRFKAILGDSWTSRLEEICDAVNLERK